MLLLPSLLDDLPPLRLLRARRRCRWCSERQLLNVHHAGLVEVVQHVKEPLLGVFVAQRHIRRADAQQQCEQLRLPTFACAAPEASTHTRREIEGENSIRVKSIDRPRATPHDIQSNCETLTCNLREVSPSCNAMSLQDQLIFGQDSVSARWNTNRAASVDCRVEFWTATTIESAARRHSLACMQRRREQLALSARMSCVGVTAEIGEANGKRDRETLRLAFNATRTEQHSCVDLCDMRTCMFASTLRCISTIVCELRTDCKWSFASRVWCNRRAIRRYRRCDSAANYCTRNRCA